MKNIKSLLIVSTLFIATSISYAASHAAAPVMPTTSATSTTKQDMAKSDLPMATAEIRKIDADNKKITLKHGEIKNLDMPGMTMVFAVKDAAMLETVKTGDKVMFTADKVGSIFTVMSIEKAK